MLQFNTQGQRGREADCASGINRTEKGINVGETEMEKKTESEEKTGR